jgi:hypothetical protein
VVIVHLFSGSTYHQQQSLIKGLKISKVEVALFFSSTHPIPANLVDFWLAIHISPRKLRIDLCQKKKLRIDGPELLTEHFWKFETTHVARWHSLQGKFY